MSFHWPLTYQFLYYYYLFVFEIWTFSKISENLRCLIIGKNGGFCIHVIFKSNTTYKDF